MHAQVEEVLIQKGWVDDEFQSAQLYVNMGREIILSNPGRYIVLHLKNDANSLLPSVTFFLELLGITQGVKGTLSVLNQAGLLAAVDHYFEGQAWLLWAVLPLLTFLGLIYIGALLGITALLRQRRWYSLLVLLLPVVYFITLPGAASNPRFRLPIMPYICLLAGTGLAFIIDSYRRRGHSETGKLIVEQQ